MIRQALRMLARDWRGGELRVLAAALVVAVASITSVSFFADRVSRALVRDAHQLLGADLVLVSDHPWKRDVADEIARRGLQRAEAANFISMARLGDASVLAGVKAVTENYPLRGRLRIAPAPNTPDAPAERGPERGTVWLEERLVSALGAPVGASLTLGSAEFKVAAVLTLEPERGANFFNIAPRLMMNAADVPATGLVQTGSRVWFYLYAAGEPAAVAAFEAWAREHLERGQRVDNLESGRPEVRASIERAQRFLGLTALLAAILAGVAIALGTRRFVERHLDGCAVMRCFGATQAPAARAVRRGIPAARRRAPAPLGCALGYAAQGAIAATLGELLRAALPAPSLLPALQGFLVGRGAAARLRAAAAGAAEERAGGARDPPRGGRAEREHARGVRGGRRRVERPAHLAGGRREARAHGDRRLRRRGARVRRGGLGGAAPRVRRAGRAALGARSTALRYGLANLRRHARSNAVQVASLALGLTAVLLLTFTRNDLVDAWRRSAPPDAPNRFLLGVQPDQVARGEPRSSPSAASPRRNSTRWCAGA